MLIVDLVETYLIIDWFCINIANQIDKEFIIETKVELVILKVIVINKIDEIDKFNKVNKNRRIALL